MAIPVFTIIPDVRLQPDAPVRSVDALALRDNPLAIAQADDADATPQVQTDGIADGAVTDVKISGLMLWKSFHKTRDNGSSAFKVLDDTMDYRDRYLKIDGRCYHGTNLGDVQRLVPGGADDNIIGSGYGNGAANDRTVLNGWFYSRNGIASATPFADPHYEQAWSGSARDTTVYVRAADGALMIHDPDPTTDYDNHAYNITVGYSVDQGEY